MRLERRSSRGLTFTSSYVLSKLLTDSDSYWPGSAATDFFNRHLEKSITHNVKFSEVYELPIGVGTTYSLSGAINNGRTPAYINSYDGWFAQTKGASFDPQVDNRFVPYGTGPFPIQGTGTALNGIGNETRLNPKARQFPNFTENVSVAKSFPIREQVRLDFRAEAFNVLNRVRFGTGSTNLQSATFGHLSSNGDLANTPRQLQFALKLYF